MKYLKWLLCGVAILSVVACKHEGQNDPVNPVTPKDPPTWEVTSHVDPVSSMTIILGFDENTLATVDTVADVIGIFAGEECLAKRVPQMTEIGPRVYFRFQGPDETLPTTLHVRYYSAQKKAYYSASEEIKYSADAVKGSTDEPFVPAWIMEE